MSGLIALLTGLAVSTGLAYHLSGPRAWLIVLDGVNERSMHQRPVPRTGGLAITVAIGAGWAVHGFGVPADALVFQVALAGLLLGVVAFADDIWDVPVFPRLLMQFVAALILVNGGLWLDGLSLPSLYVAWSPWLGIAVSVLFIVWMTNLYNFMDGADGLSAGMAFVGFSTYAILGWSAGDHVFANLCMVVAAASAGFLLFNLPPARIFMGDLGASVLGLLVAAFALWAAKAGVFPLWIGLLVFSPFIVDATVTLFRRLFAGHKVWIAHRTHYYQRLILSLGWHPRRALLLQYGIMFAAAVSALVATQLEAHGQWLLLIGWAVLYVVLFSGIAWLESRQRTLADPTTSVICIWPRLAATLHDLSMIPLAWFGAYWLRFNLGEFPQAFFQQASLNLAPILLIQGFCFWYFGLYRGVWRFASIPDLIRIIKSVAVGITVAAPVLFLLTRLEGLPRSVLPMYGLLLLMLIGGPRLAYRWFKDQSLASSPGRRTLIVGAGRAGEMLVRDMLWRQRDHYDPVGLVDDDAQKKGKEIHGLRVLGHSAVIPQLVAKYDVELVLIAIPSANSEQMRRIVAACQAANVVFRTLPAVVDIVDGRADLQCLRKVSIEDLLGRQQVALDWELLRGGLEGRRVLVSGAGGSIGSELCQQIARLNPANLILLESNEFSLYRIEKTLRDTSPWASIQACLGDVTDAEAVRRVLSNVRPEVIFHAAAYKHVPMLEISMREAIRNNVLGTRVLAKAAEKSGCRSFVLISSDKAVNPSSVMGATKRVAEIYCQNLNRRSRVNYITVRFGNVLGSTGSVVPLFEEQIAKGGPVTVTHPEVRRYFMTVSEAVQLIMQASVLGHGGEIFVLNMGEPVRIRDLAEQMIRLAGKSPGEDVEIVYTGLRLGEKLNEELFHDFEPLTPTGHEKLYLARHREADWLELNRLLTQLEIACRDYDEPRLERLLHRLVPEFRKDEAPPQSAKILPLTIKRGNLTYGTHN